jgi:hypothetical protein
LTKCEIPGIKGKKEMMDDLIKIEDVQKGNARYIGEI